MADRWGKDIEVALGNLLNLAPIAQRSRLERAVAAAYEETDSYGYDCDCRRAVALGILAELNGFEDPDA